MSFILGNIQQHKGENLNATQAIDAEIASIKKKVQPVNVWLYKTGDGVYKGTLPFKIEGDYILNSKEIKDHPVVVEYLDSQVVVQLESDEEKINAFLSKDESVLLQALKANIKTDGLKEEPSFIIGPPGTGKTKVITKILEEAMSADKKVLVVSPTNMAVENVFERLDTKSTSLKDGEVVLTIKTQVDILQEYSQESIKQRKLSPIKDEIEILKMAKESMLKTIRDAQPTIEAKKSKKEVTSTMLHNLNKDFSEIANKHKEVQTLLEEIKGRIEALTSNSFLKGVANMFLSEKLKELEELKNNYEKSLQVLREKMDQIDVEIQKAKNKDSNALKELKKAKDSEREARDSIQKITDRIKELDKEAEKISSGNLFDAAKIVGATLVNAALNKKIQEGDFDMIIVDEASMATVPYLYVAAQALNEKNIEKIDYKDDKSLYAAQNDAVRIAINSKIIFVGDPKQLPPIANTYEMRQTIFDIYGAVNIFKGENVKNTVLLDINFRNHPDITALASKLFYGGLLKSGKKSDGKSSLFVRRSTSKMVFSQGSYVNHGNAAIVREQVAKALQRGRRSIGVITPYKKQAMLIEEGFEQLKNEYPDADIQAGTVHTFQGKEKGIIIYDLTYSPSEMDNGVVPATYNGDINSNTAKLLNVAMTRAEDFFIVVGDVEGIKNNLPDGLAIKSWVEEIANMR